MRGLFMQHAWSQINAPRLFAGVFAFIFAAAAVAADRVELTDGSVVMGKLLSAESGKMKIETSFAGTIEIAQAKVKSFSTDDTVVVGLNSGSTVQGKVEMVEGGIKIVAPDGQMSAATANVAAVWLPGADSPTVSKLKAENAAKARKWAYETNVAIAGRSGATEKFGAAAGFKATLESPADKLIFAAAAERAKENGRDTANSQKGSADYSAFFNPTNVWYARTGLEKDKIKDLDLRSTTAVGLGHKAVKTDVQDLEFRLGVSYVYETYANNTKFDSPGLDLAMIHNYKFSNATLANLITINPAFKSFSNYRLHHESTIELPIAASLWKLRSGVANDYQSKVTPGVERLDTTYFTSLVLSWK